MQPGEDATSPEPSSADGSPTAPPLPLPAAAPPVGRVSVFLRLLALHSAQLAARLAERHHAGPWLPLREAAAARAAAEAAVQDACSKLGVADISGLRDLMNSAVLAECVYKIMDHGTQRVSVSASGCHYHGRQRVSVSCGRLLYPRQAANE